MGLDATVDRNPKHLPDHLRERVIVDSACGVMDLRINLRSQEVDELEKITSASREPAHFISQMRSLIAGANRDGNGIVF
jgi:hypothetical protein